MSILHERGVKFFEFASVQYEIFGVSQSYHLHYWYVLYRGSIGALLVCVGYDYQFYLPGALFIAFASAVDDSRLSGYHWTLTTAFITTIITTVYNDKNNKKNKEKKQQNRKKKQKQTK